MAAIRINGSYLQVEYQRLRPRPALGAVMDSMLTVIWHMLSTGETYRDLGGDYAITNDRSAASSTSSKRSATPSRSRGQSPEVAPPFPVR